MLPRATYRLGSAPDRRWSLAKPSLRPAVFFLVSTGADTEYSNLWWQTVMIGAGIGLTVPPMTSALLATVDRKQSGRPRSSLQTILAHYVVRPHRLVVFVLQDVTVDGLKARILIAVGASQSASRLTPYYNSIQPLHRVYDGFLLHVGGGLFRTDISAKLLRINTEREIVAGQASIRQPDSNIFRSWEIAGASHVDYWYMTYRQALVARDGLAPFNYQCDKEPLSHVNNKYVLNAGYAQLVDWIFRNRPPVVANPIVVTSVSPTVIPRDANGLVFGGIRLATVEVPTA